jgi:hypothetical protein
MVLLGRFATGDELNEKVSHIAGILVGGVVLAIGLSLGVLVILLSTQSRFIRDLWFASWYTRSF